jgi:hypothetical protein
MTLTKWDADLIDGLDELDGGVDVDGDYLPLEGGTLTGELTVDANLILEGAITEGDCVLRREFANSEFTLPEDPYQATYPQSEYMLSPSKGAMQYLYITQDWYNNKLSTKNSLFITASSQSATDIIQEDQDYFFEDGQSMTIRIELDDALVPLYSYGYNIPSILDPKFAHRWHDDIWWVNTKDGLAPDLNETGAITVNLWKAKGIVYGQLAGDFVKQEYHPDAFDFRKVKMGEEGGWHYENQHDARVIGAPSASMNGNSVTAVPGDPYIWNPEGGIVYRQGTAFARTSLDRRHFFVGQSGSDGWFDKKWPNHGNKLYPGELRVFGSKTGSTSPLPQPYAFQWGGAPGSISPPNSLQEDSPLLGSATDMRLRVDKGTGVDFKPDGTKMFQSVACYYDPSLKDKYKNVIGYHRLVIPWDVGTTDFLVKEELNDIIYCDEKYSDILALHPEHPDMRICGLTFRPDGMGFYFAYVLYSLTSQDLEYYLVQQDLTAPWELSSAKDDYKYSGKITHGKAPGPSSPHIWQINGITVSGNGRFIHAVYPHNYLGEENDRCLAHPRQFEMTTPWDISTAGMDTMWWGLGPEPDKAGQWRLHPGWRYADSTHDVYWSDSGEYCFFTGVAEVQPGSGSKWSYSTKAGVYRQFRLGMHSRH